MHVIYVHLRDPGLAVRRVQQRVARGGHEVPQHKIEERYPRSLANLLAVMNLADSVRVYDNSVVDRLHRHVATIKQGQVVWLDEHRVGDCEILTRLLARR